MNSYADHDDPILEEDEGTPQPNPYKDGDVQQDSDEEIEDPPGYEPEES